MRAPASRADGGFNRQDQCALINCRAGDEVILCLEGDRFIIERVNEKAAKPNFAMKGKGALDRVFEQSRPDALTLTPQINSKASEDDDRNGVGKILAHLCSWQTPADNFTSRQTVIADDFPAVADNESPGRAPL